MQSRLTEIKALDATLLAISADPPDVLRETADAYAFGFPLLADPELTAIDAYGLRHVGGGLEGDISRPAVFVIDREGRIAWHELTENWRVRLDPQRLIDQLRLVP